MRPFTWYPRVRIAFIYRTVVISLWKEHTHIQTHTHGGKEKPPKQSWAENKEFVFTVGSGDNTWHTEIDWVVVCSECVCLWMCVCLFFHLFVVLCACVSVCFCMVTPSPGSSPCRWDFHPNRKWIAATSCSEHEYQFITQTQMHTHTYKSIKVVFILTGLIHIFLLPLLCLCMCKFKVTFPELIDPTPLYCLNLMTNLLSSLLSCACTKLALWCVEFMNHIVLVIIPKECTHKLSGSIRGVHVIPLDTCFMTQRRLKEQRYPDLLDITLPKKVWVRLKSRDWVIFPHKNV